MQCLCVRLIIFKVCCGLKPEGMGKSPVRESMRLDYLMVAQVAWEIVADSQR